MLPLAHIEVRFTLDGETFEVENFDIDFEQPTDYKGQPQHEIEGGQMTIHISQVATNNLYTWAKTSTLQKSGTVLFQTDMGMTVLEVEFFNAYCVNLSRQINAYTGTKTILLITPEKVKLNGVDHDNRWT
jgi:hypothetical protein